MSPLHMTSALLWHYASTGCSSVKNGLINYVLSSGLVFYMYVNSVMPILNFIAHDLGSNMHTVECNRG